MAHRNSAVTWQDVKLQIQETLRARGLADPSIRINALGSLERLLQRRYPEVLEDPGVILNHPKPVVVTALARLKANGKLNSAEKSVLNNVYQIIGGSGMTRRDRVGLAPRDTSVRTPQEVGRENSDEDYVIDLCDEVLSSTALRQHRFAFLRGDARLGRQGVRLPVDAFYPDLKLVVEYRERQHTEDVAFFDKPEWITVSGVHRGEQRRLYDARRREVLPKHGIALIELSYADFGHNVRKRLMRNRIHDIDIVESVLSRWLTGRR